MPPKNLFTIILVLSYVDVEQFSTSAGDKSPKRGDKSRQPPSIEACCAYIVIEVRISATTLNSMGHASNTRPKAA